MKVMNVRRVVLLLLVAFVVAVAVGAVLPKPVMAEITSVLTGSVVHADVWDCGCTICYVRPWPLLRVCHYYNPCQI